MAREKIQYCDYCGADMGVFARYHGEKNCCGERECARMEREDYEIERAEAHERLDQENGWGRY
jgi:hypothetical protein